MIRVTVKQNYQKGSGNPPKGPEAAGCKEGPARMLYLFHWLTMLLSPNHP